MMKENIGTITVLLNTEDDSVSYTATNFTGCTTKHVFENLVAASVWLRTEYLVYLNASKEI